MMASSLPHVTSNHVSYNGLYGVAVFSQKEGSGEFPGGHGAQENFSEDGDAILWEAELENDDPLRRPIATALVESNSVSHNGGEHPSHAAAPRPSSRTGHLATRLVPPPAGRPSSLFSHHHPRPSLARNSFSPTRTSKTTRTSEPSPAVRPSFQLGPPPAPLALVRGAETAFVSVAASSVLTGEEQTWRRGTASHSCWCSLPLGTSPTPGIYISVNSETHFSYFFHTSDEMHLTVNGISWFNGQWFFFLRLTWWLRW